MKTLLFAVLLSIVQATPPVPRQTTDTANQAPEKAEKGTAQHKEPVTPTPSPKQVVEEPPRKEAPANNPTSVNAEQTVRVRELPPVSVSRDWADWTLWAGSALLTIVGIIGICIAVKTLKALKIQAVIMRRQTKHIARQALSMRRQTRHLRNSVIQARKGARAAIVSADAAKASADALVNSERARLVVEFVQKAAIYGGQWHRIEPYGPVLLTTEEVLAGKHLNYDLKITNIGRTPAELFELQIGWGSLTEGRQFSTEELPNQQTRSVNEFWGAGESRSMYSFNSMETFDRALNGDQKGVIYATIKYGDTVSDEARRQHSSFVLYHCGNSGQPLRRINTQTKYT